MKKTILYLGKDMAFLDDLSAASREWLKACEIKYFFSEPGLLVPQTCLLEPHIIFVDAEDAHYLAEEIRLIKSLPQGKSILVAAVCKDEEEVSKSTHLFTCGTTLFYVKGTEVESFFLDCFMIAFEAGKKFRPFARASDLDLHLPLKLLACLSTTNARNAVVECDADFDDHLELKLPFLVDTPAASFSIVSKSNAGFTGPFLKTYQLAYPFPGPWDEITPETIQPQTIETWIDLNKEQFDPRQFHISIFHNDKNLIPEMFNETSNSAWIDFHQEVIECGPILSLKQPQLIFFNLLGEEGFPVQQLSRLMSAVSEMGDNRPLVLVFNSPSDSEALRKLFDYPNLLASPGALDMKLYSALLQKFIARKKTEAEVSFLKVQDQNRVCEIPFTSVLTSMTEHEVTFIAPLELPLFTVIKTELPLPLFLTIVPQPKPLKASDKGIHYKGIIHGVDEETLTKLRKLVNQIIYRPLKHLDADTVEIMLKQEYVAKPTAVQEEEKDLKEMLNEDMALTIQSPDERFNLRRSQNGKSKL